MWIKTLGEDWVNSNSIEKLYIRFNDDVHTRAYVVYASPIGNSYPFGHSYPFGLFKSGDRRECEDYVKNLVKLLNKEKGGE